MAGVYSELRGFALAHRGCASPGTPMWTRSRPMATGCSSSVAAASSSSGGGAAGCGAGPAAVGAASVRELAPEGAASWAEDAAVP